MPEEAKGKGNHVSSMSLSVGMNLLTPRQLAGNEHHCYDHDIIVEWSIPFSSKELAPVCALETLLEPLSFFFIDL